MLMTQAPNKICGAPIPCKELGLPKGCKNLDIVPLTELVRDFFDGLIFLAQPIEIYLR